MEKKKIVIVMPAYNAASTLGNTVREIPVQKILFWDRIYQNTMQVKVRKI